MSANWVYHWVQIMAHHKRMLGVLWLLLIVLGVSGALQGDWLASVEFSVKFTVNSQDSAASAFWQSSWFLWVMAIILVSGVFGWQAESFKSGLLHAGFLVLTSFIVIGLSGWMQLQWSVLESFALLIALTLVTANFIHLLSTLHREMARGLFQFDAVAEAIRLNHTPIFLSNLTTALGVFFLAQMNDALSNFAWVLSLGALVSYLLSISVFPWVLLNWLLEFRVGNTRDRKGFYGWVERMEQLADKPWLKPLLWGLLVASAMTFAWQLQGVIDVQIMTQLFGFLLVLGALFLVWWRNLSWTLLILLSLTWISLMAIFVLHQFAGIQGADIQGRSVLEQGGLMNGFANRFGVIDLESLWLLLLVAPMGIVVDDLIHFFARYDRAKLSVFGQGRDAVRFAMMSVGRPIFVTSLTLALAMLLVLLVAKGFVKLLAVVVLISIFWVTFFVFITLPLILLQMRKSL